MTAKRSIVLVHYGTMRCYGRLLPLQYSVSSFFAVGNFIKTNSVSTATVVDLGSDLKGP